MKIGYARISTREQNLDLQIFALEKAGCEKIYEEIVTGSKVDRPILNNLLDQLRAGDTLVVWKIDRLGRSIQHLISIVQRLLKNDIGLLSLNDPIDTTTSQGRFIFNIFASLAEFERDMIIERTRAGISAARARGRLGGRPKGIPKESLNTAYASEALYKEGNLSVMDIAKQLNISRTTLYRYLRYRNVALGKYEQSIKI